TLHIQRRNSWQARQLPPPSHAHDVALCATQRASVVSLKASSFVSSVSVPLLNVAAQQLASFLNNLNTPLQVVYFKIYPLCLHSSNFQARQPDHSKNTQMGLKNKRATPRSLLRRAHLE